MLKIFIQFSSRYIKERKGRTLTTLFGIILGIVLIISTAIINRSAKASYQNMVSSAAGKSQLQVLPVTDSGFSSEYLSQIKNTNGVKDVFPVIVGNSQVYKNDKMIDLILIYGINTKKDRKVREYDIVRGRFLKDIGREIILTEQYAKINNFKYNGNISILTNHGLKNFKIVGIISSKGAGNTNGGKFAVINMNNGQQIFSRQDKYDQVDIVLEENKDVEEVKKTLNNKFNNDLNIERPSGRGKDIEDTMATYNFFLSLTGGVSLLVGLFIIYNNMEISLEERRFHIAMLRALGLRRKKILVLILTEAGFLGLIGGVIGLFLGLGLARVMATFVAQITSSLFRINITHLAFTPRIIITGIIAGPAIAMFSSLMSAYRILSIDPLETLTPMETSWGKRSRLTIFIGIVSLFIGVIILLSFVILSSSYIEKYNVQQVEAVGILGIALSIFGVIVLMPSIIKYILSKFNHGYVVFRIALGNLVRTPGRTSATIAGIMVALIMMVMVASLSLSTERLTQDWINKAIGWDMLVSSSYQGTKIDVPIDKELGQKLRQMKEVKIVNTLRFTTTKYRDKTLNLLNFEMDTLFDFGKFDVLSGDEKTLERKMQTGRYIAITSVASRKLDLKVGDSMKFITPNGPVSYKIAAIVNEIGSDIGTVYLDQPTYKKQWNDSRVDGYDVKLKEGYEVKEVREKIEKQFGKDYHFNIREHEDFKNEILSLVNQSFALANLIVYIALFVAAIGIMNTALITVWQRKREISTIRALGARKLQTGLILLVETMTMGLSGSVVGLSIGIFMGKVLVDANASVSGVKLDFYMPWAGLIAGFTLSILLSILSSIIPGQVAARTNIIEGLRYE